MRCRLSILGVLTSVFCIISCEDNYYIENDLHGMWQVTSVEKITGGESTEYSGLLYYSFQRNIVMLSYNHSNAPENMTRYIAPFELIGIDSMGVGEFRYYTTGEGDYVNQELQVPLDSLIKFGICQPYTSFQMKLSKHKLILTSDSACITLRKY